MKLLLAGAQPGLSLGILGPGNLNDVELGPLLSSYQEIHLIDIDQAAVRRGLARQGVAGSSQIRVHPPTDLTGLFSPSAIHNLRSRHRFGVTASTGILTQLLQSVVESGLGADDSVAMCLAVRDRHLMDLLELTQPGGSFILITDVVSTSTAPDLLETPADELEGRMAALVSRRNFFTGVNPYRIVAVLEEMDPFAALIANVELVDPWMWAVTDDRQHLTCAVSARRVP